VRYNSRGDPGLLSMLPRDLYAELGIVAGELRDLPAMMSAMRNVEMVFDLGALIAMPCSYRHPVEVVQPNVMGIREFGVRHAVEYNRFSYAGPVYSPGPWPSGKASPLHGEDRRFESGRVHFRGAP
jgi:hypothetical protein